MSTMKPQAPTIDVRLVVAAACLVAAIFIVDLYLPLGVAVPMAYVVPVLLSLWLADRRFTIVAAAVGTLLTVAGIFNSPKGGVLWIALVNRGLAITVIWTTAALVLLHKQAQEDIKTLRGWLAMCASCKKIRDDEGFWQGLEHYVEEHSQVLFTHSLCPACTQKWYPELYPQLVERH